MRGFQKLGFCEDFQTAIQVARHGAVPSRAASVQLVIIMCWHSLQAPMERVFEQAYRKVHAKAQSHPKPSSTMHFDHFIPRPACFSISSSSFPEGANWLPSHMTCGATAAKGLTQGHSLQAVCLGEAQVSALPASAQIGPWLVPGEPKAQSLLDFFVGFRLRLSSVV